MFTNDGISQVGVEKLENNGFKVITTNQDQIIDYINKNSLHVYWFEVQPK